MEMSVLKQARISANLSIEEVARQLNIRKNYIIAIEENRLNEIPFVVYAKGYTKMYAEFLGITIDPADLNFAQESSYKKIITGFSAKAKLGLVVSASFIVIIGIWFYMINFTSAAERDVVDHLENLEPTNHLSNVQQFQNDTNNIEEIVYPIPSTQGKLNEFNE